MLCESRVILRAAQDVLRAMGPGDAGRAAARAVDATVSRSIVGTLLPLLATAVSVVASSAPAAICATLGNDASTLSQLLADVSSFASSAVRRAGVKGGDGGVPRRTVKAPAWGVLNQVLESKHEYENSMDTYETVAVPGAVRYIVEFDERTRTENSRDYGMARWCLRDHRL